MFHHVRPLVQIIGEVRGQTQGMSRPIAPLDNPQQPSPLSR